MTNSILQVVERSQRKSGRRCCYRRNLFVLFGTSFIIIIAVVINITFLSKHSNKILSQQQQQQQQQQKSRRREENKQNDDAAVGIETTTLTIKTKTTKKKQKQKQSYDELNSISAAKDYFSVIVNKNRPEDFITAYNPDRKANVDVDLGVAKKKIDDKDEAGIILLLEKQKKKEEENDAAHDAVHDNNSADESDESDSSPKVIKVIKQIKLLLPLKEIEWIKHRDNEYIIEYINNDKLKNRKKKRWKQKINFNNITEVNNIYQEDINGPWLDFMIAGHPKCGTTTLVANLANIAPMKVKDFCTGEMSTLLGYVYRTWRDKFPEILDGPKKYMFQPQSQQPQPQSQQQSSTSLTSLTSQITSAGNGSSNNNTDNKNNNNNNNNTDNRIELKGAKCPRFLGDPSLILKFGTRYPKTKIIFGIRHPVLWFTSFFNMGHVGDLYSKMKLCPNMDGVDYNNINNNDNNNDNNNYNMKGEKEVCIGECRCGLPVCFHRARLHLPIARLGKTLLSDLERQLIAPDDPDGGTNLINGRIKNPIFLYEQTQMFDKTKTNSENNDNGIGFWDSLAKFIGVSYIPNENYHSSKGHGHNKTLCTDYYDEFRSKMMEHSYNMSIWLEEYLLPIADDPNRTDVVMHNVNEFRTIIQSYKYDPCKRLIRNATSGEYILKPTIDVNNGLGPGIMTRIIGTGKVNACRGHYASDRKQKEKQQLERKAIQELKLD